MWERGSLRYVKKADDKNLHVSKKPRNYRYIIMESYSSTHYYRNLSNDAADQSSNGSDGGGFSMTVVSIQILFIVSIVVPFVDSALALL